MGIENVWAAHKAEGSQQHHWRATTKLKIAKIGVNSECPRWLA